MNMRSTPTSEEEIFFLFSFFFLLMGDGDEVRNL